MIYYYMHVRMTKIWNTENTKCWWVCGTIEIVTDCWWECQMVSHFERQVISSRTALLLSRFSCVQLCATPQTAARSSVPGILQARILEWVAISFSNACMHAKSLQTWLTMQQPTRLLCPWDSLGKNIGVSCHFFLHLTKLSILLPYDPAITLLHKTFYAFTCVSIYLHKNLHMDVYSSFIHNCQNLEATKMFFSG